MANDGRIRSVLPYQLPSMQQLIYVKTNIAGYFFDAFIDMHHTHESNITSHPVQSGANITDHIYSEPAELSMTIRMSDSMAGLVAGQFVGSYTRSVSAYNILRELQKQRVPFQVMTRLEMYQNMVIQTLSVPDDYKTQFGLEVKVTMKQILVANVKTVKISNRANATNSVNTGTLKVSNAEEVSPVKKALDLKKRLINPFG